MNLKDLDNVDAVKALVAAGHLQLGEQLSYNDLLTNIALYLSRAGYYGTYDPITNETTPLDLSKTSFVSSGVVNLLIVGTVQLPIAPSITGGGSIVYYGKGQLLVDATVVYDGSSGGSPLVTRVQSVTSAATVTPNADSNDLVIITAQAVDLLLANPTGTPTQGQGLIIRIKDNNTAHLISFDTLYRAIGVVLPTTTVIGKTLYIALIYNATDTKWDVIGIKQQA